MILASSITGVLLELLGGLALVWQHGLLRRLELCVGHGLLRMLPQQLRRAERHSQLLYWIESFWYPGVHCWHTVQTTWKDLDSYDNCAYLTDVSYVLSWNYHTGNYFTDVKLR